MKKLFVIAPLFLFTFGFIKIDGITEAPEELAHGKEISFRFNQAPLVDIIDMLAKEKGFNIVIPAGQQSITEKITFSFPQKIAIEEAWERLLSFLRICGYSVIVQREFVTIIKNDPKELTRQPFPLYIQASPTELPQSDEKIRYLYYFCNVQIGVDANAGGAGSLQDILTAFLSKDALVVVDEGINAVIITDNARHIASSIYLLKELDERQASGDSKEIITLKHTDAITIASYMQSIINPTGKQVIADITSPSLTQYFPKNIRVMAEPRTNSLILLGKKEPLARVRLFIEEFIDVKIDSGESILHLYDLQYLDAVTFQQTLANILNSQSSGASQSSGSNIEHSGKQYFKDVIIAAEATQAINPSYLASVASGSAPLNVQTGNRLIIAARRDDWLRIEKLIKELDKPQQQVAIEVLIVDLSITDNNSLGAQLRNLAKLTLGNANFQTSFLNGNAEGVFITDPMAPSVTPPTTLEADLLQSTGTNGDGTEVNMISNFSPGSFVLAFNDPNTNGMWLILQMLKSYQDVKILSQPFIIALNNQQCTFSSDETRLLPGASTVVPGGGGVQSSKDAVNAKLGVTITPTISRDMRITLSIDISIQEFQGSSTVVLSRTVHTNVNIKDGEVLVLGGLTKTQLTKSVVMTPILGQIPIIGNLFKSRQDTNTKDNLIVFIAPRIINPKKDQQFDPYTAHKINNVNQIFKSTDYETLKDPITRWMFGTDDNEVSVKSVKNLGKKDLFGGESETETRIRTLIINKNEKLSEDVIKKTPDLIPSPDKQQLLPIKEKTKIEYTKTGVPKIKVVLPKPQLSEEEKERIDKLVDRALEDLDQVIPEKIIPPAKTATGLPLIKVEIPSVKPNTISISGDNKKNEKQSAVEFNEKKATDRKKVKQEQPKKEIPQDIKTEAVKTKTVKKPSITLHEANDDDDPDDLKKLAAKLNHKKF